MSVPQHSGDLIFPCPFGHTEIATLEPSSFTRTSSTKAASHAPQVVLTDIPQVGQVYRAMGETYGKEGGVARLWVKYPIYANRSRNSDVSRNNFLRGIVVSPVSDHEWLQ